MTSLIGLDAYQPQIRAIFRAMLSVIFLTAGLNHVLQPEHIARRLENAPLGFLATLIASPTALVLLTGVVLFAGGLALLTGFQTRRAALVLFALLIPITLTVQVGSLSTMGPLAKNIGLAGGLLYFAAHGADSFSFDHWRNMRRNSSHPTSTKEH